MVNFLNFKTVGYMCICQAFFLRTAENSVILIASTTWLRKKSVSLDMVPVGHINIDKFVSQNKTAATITIILEKETKARCSVFPNGAKMSFNLKRVLSLVEH